MPAIIHFTFSSIVTTSTSMWVLTVCSYQPADVTELHPVTDSCSLPPKLSAHNCNPCLLSSTCLLQYIPNSALVMSFPQPSFTAPPSLPPTICRNAQSCTESCICGFVRAVCQTWNALFLARTNPMHSSRPSLPSLLQL